MKTEYIDVTSADAMQNPTERQKATCAVLAKLRSFCAENELGIRDMENLVSLLTEQISNEAISRA